MNNSIVWGSSTPLFEGTISVRYSDVQGGFDGDGNIDSNPELVDLSGGDLRLSPSLPCIDAAYGMVAMVAPELDMDGNARFDDPGIDNAGYCEPCYVDMGAYEYRP